MFTFPLSIQTAEPTPLDTNHIWIQNATKRRIVFDDAIRSSPPGDSYWFIQDNMDNSFVYLQSPIKTTNNITLNSILRKGNRDTITWRLSERGGTNGSGHVAISDGDHGYTLTVPNFILTNGCQVTFKSPNDVQETQWLWVTINSGNLYAVRTVGQEILPAAAWKVNSMVTLTISVTDPFYVGDGVGGRNGYAFLRAALGQLKKCLLSHSVSRRQSLLR